MRYTFDVVERVVIASKSMASAIPKDVVLQLKRDPFMQQCCVCERDPQWHHNFEYGRKAINEAWCILPLCHEHHQIVRQVPFRRLLDWAMLNRATAEDLQRYSRAMDYKSRLKWLNGIFGEFSPRNMRDLYTSRKYEKTQ